jgi:hypothetical protein
MYRRSIGIYKLERLRNIMQPPFRGLFAKALPLDMPAQRAQSLGRNVNVRLCLYCVQNLYDARVPQGS